MKKLHVVGLVATTALALSGCQGQNDTVEPGVEGGSLKGKKIDLIVPFSPGGGYDQYARQLAPALAEELGATVVVVNKPGAGGLLATNELINAKPDGTTISIFNMTGHIGSALADAEGVRYDPVDFGYLGQISSEPDVVLVKTGGPYKTFEDLAKASQSKPVRFAATGPGSNEYVDPLVLDSVLGVKTEVVTGYEGGSEAALAVLQGDVDAHSRSLYSQLPAVKDKDAAAVLVVGSEPSPELPSVPTIVEMAKDDNQRELLEFHSRLVESGRAFAVPPNMDEDLLEELRTAYENVVTDPEFMAAAESAGRPIVFTSGEEVQQEVEELMDAPENYVAILKKAYSGA